MIIITTSALARLFQPHSLLVRFLVRISTTGDGPVECEGGIILLPMLLPCTSISPWRNKTVCDFDARKRRLNSPAVLRIMATRTRPSSPPTALSATAAKGTCTAGTGRVTWDACHRKRLVEGSELLARFAPRGYYRATH